MTQAPDDLGIDLMSGTFYEREPYDAYAWMRANAPVYYDEPNDLWAVASYAGVKAASVDTESFSNAGGHPAQERPAAHDDRLRRPRARTPAPPRLRRASPPGGCGPWRTTCGPSATPSSTTSAKRGAATWCATSPPRSPSSSSATCWASRPTDRDDLLRWSDDMLKALGSPDPSLMEAAANAFVEYTDVHPPGLRRPAPPGLRRRPGRGPLSRHHRRRLARRRLPGARDPAHPHRGRRDHPPRDQRRDGRAPGPSRAGAAPGRRPRAHDRRRRGDAALGLAHQEHGPHDHPGRRAGRHVHPGRPGAHPPLPLGQPGRQPSSTTPTPSTSPAPPIPTWPSVSARISAWATSWPGWSSR